MVLSACHCLFPLLRCPLPSQLASCASVDRRWSTWAEEAMWMTPYFTVCVWFSVWLAAYAPRVDTDVPGMRALIVDGSKAKRR